MKLLLLNGYGVRMNVENAKLHITDGVTVPGEAPLEYVFAPKRIDVEHIILYGRTGNLSVEAIRWVIKHNVQITILDWDGKLLTTMLPPESVQVKTKFAQYQAYGSPQKRLEIARKVILAKFARTRAVLAALHQRYPDVKEDLSTWPSQLVKAKTLAEIMTVEGRVAGVYWQEFGKAVPAEYEFENRQYQKRPRGAGDTANCLLNYGYAILEAEVLRGINGAGLDAHIGFLHEMRIGANSLAYDLQEPFRFLVDLAVLDLLESGTLERSDFIRSETYTLRLRASGAKKLVNAIEEKLAKKVNFNSQQWSVRYVIQEKIRELAHFLVGKRSSLDLTAPLIPIERQDTDAARQQILALNYIQWEKMGFSRGTLHYLKANARAGKPFTMNKHVKERLESLRTHENPVENS